MRAVGTGRVQCPGPRSPWLPVILHPLEFSLFLRFLVGFYSEGFTVPRLETSEKEEDALYLFFFLSIPTPVKVG